MHTFVSRFRSDRRWRIVAMIIAIVAFSGCSAASALREDAASKGAGRAEAIGKISGRGRKPAPTTTASSTTTSSSTTTTDPAADGAKALSEPAAKPAELQPKAPTTSGTKQALAAPATTAAPATKAPATTATTAPPSTTAAPSAPSRTPTGPTVLVTAYGAVPDDGADDSVALQRAFDAAPSGTTVVLPPGTYHHDRLLNLHNDGVSLFGYDATLVGTDRTNHALVVRGDGVTVAGLTIVNSPTQRLSAEEQMGISLHYSKGTTVRETTVRGTSSAGIFIWGATDYKILDNVVENTLSDGIHSVGGARNGLIQGNRLRNVGDDCFAVISYIAERAITGNIVVRDNSCVGGKARGMSVVGGEDVLFQNNRIEASGAAGVYLASEPSYDTYAATRVQVIGNTLVGVNTTSAIRHGGVFIWGRSGTATTSDGVAHSLQNSDLLIQGNRIEGTVNGAANIVAQGSDSLRVNFIGNVTVGGNHAYLELNGGQYNQVGESHNGASIADRIGLAAILP